MSETLTLLLAVHNHQPVGNFVSVFDRAFRDCYLPFFRLLERHPRVRMTVHFSGPLWEAMKSKERAAFDLVSGLVKRRQIELMGGGFYEPILAIIPEVDRQGQLRMMNEFLEDSFGAPPRGAWLTERVWEPNLAKTLALAGIEYTLLDEEHFRYAGIEDIHRIYITEDEGRPLRLFPIDKKLRYLIPFRPIEEIAVYLDEVRNRGGLAILGDDGEKFGMWPGTKAWVYDEGWLEWFFSFLESAPRIETRTYAEALESGPLGGRVYLPPGSYEEMMAWVLEPDDARTFEVLKKGVSGPARRFLRGGFFREFFLKYPESDHLHKRMLAVSRGVFAGGDEAARRELYQAQCNDPYWHGVFGGLYLPHLREAAYYHLLQAETLTPAPPGWQAGDTDADGQIVVARRDGRFGLHLKPARGGALTEIDYFPQGRNLSDVLSRRPEAYHQRHEPGQPGEGKSIHEMGKALPPGAERMFRYDWHPRWCGLDHFLHPDTTTDGFQSGAYAEQGDFINRPYTWSIVQDRLFLSRKGVVWSGERQVPISVQKEIRPEDSGFHFLCTITNLDDRDADLLFGSEWNFYQIPEEFAFDEGGASLAGGRLRFSFEPARDMWCFPLQTLSQSEKGYDIIHQGFCLLPLWRLQLPAMGSFTLRVHLRENRDA
ncbi:MAG: DUF1926 domain-containing protein [Candidatus Aminicenantes bacterium]|nr:DUF1926 domain-containing protein [Candidatus Aminicenantes bacterium]